MNIKLKRSLDRALLFAGVTLVVASAVVLISTADEDDSATSAGGGGSAAMVDTVEIKDFKFLPADASVPVGTKLTFANADTAPHTATSGKGASPDGVFNTKTLQKDGSRSVTLKKAGTFTYYCKFHSFMKGTVTVK